MLKEKPLGAEFEMKMDMRTYCLHHVNKSERSWQQYDRKAWAPI